MIHLHKLRLTAAHRTYEVDFDKQGSNLAIIAGPIHTGKTTVLQMVHYLLGAAEHPTHPELASTVRIAELDLSVNGTSYTIERPLFSSEQVAYLREFGSEGGRRVERKVIDPPGDSASLSAWLLSAIGLGDSRVRVTEGNPNTSTHDLSIRDVMWLAFLPSKRLDNQSLLHEGHDQKHYKLRQVIEMLFDIHDDRLGQLLDQQKRLREEKRDAEQEAIVVEAFLAEEEVPPKDDVIERRTGLVETQRQADEQLAELTRASVALTGYADDLRARYAAARVRTSRSAARVQDREALYERLLPLRGQYAEDERKLVFSDEAKRLFDPLSVSHCPACLNELPASPTVESGQCSMCSQVLEETSEPVFSVKQERQALRRRIKDLDSYIERVNAQIGEAQRELVSDQRQQDALGRELDDRTADQLSPFIGQRDQLVAQLAALRAEASDLDRALRWFDALERRNGQVDQVSSKLAAVKEQLETLRANQPGRSAVVAEASERFASLLRDWGFPKVDDPEGPFLDEKFVPQVRGRVYRGIGSDGALTLISVAWTLALFELAVERGGPHPGFLMLDSPQKNLAPTVASPGVDEYMDPAIVERMYRHIATWLSAHPDAQIVVVDHNPPIVVEDQVVVRYTRRSDRPPYGLIEDQTGTEAGSA